MMKLVAAVAVLIFALASTAFAEEALPPLSLSQTVSLALERNHALLAGRDNLEAARAASSRASSAFLPKVEISETFMRTDNPVMSFMSKLNQGRFTQADFAISNLNDPSPINNFNTRVQVTQPLFNGGKELVGLELARAGEESAAKGFERTRQETAFMAVRAYYGVALAAEQVKVADAAVRATEEHVSVVEKFYGQDMVISSEVLLAKVRLAEVKEMFIRAKNSEATARASLNSLIARPLNNGFCLTDSLGMPEFQAALSDLQREALENRPDLARITSEEKGAASAVRLAKTDYLPNINLVGRYDIDDRSFLRGSGDSYTVMGTLNWKIFDGLQTASSVREARARQSSARHMLEGMRDAVALEVLQNYNGVQEARQRVGTAAASVAEAEEGLRVLKLRFENGMARTQEVLDAEAALTRARTSRAQALYDYNIALAGLKLAVGRGETL
ncbi:MAG TPA: TolC family protein [Nitrospirota bacterium]|jgi:outer membrane protein TolC